MLVVATRIAKLIGHAVTGMAFPTVAMIYAMHAACVTSVTTVALRRRPAIVTVRFIRACFIRRF